MSWMWKYFFLSWLASTLPPIKNKINSCSYEVYLPVPTVLYVNKKNRYFLIKDCKYVLHLLKYRWHFQNQSVLDEWCTEIFSFVAIWIFPFVSRYVFFYISRQISKSNNTSIKTYIVHDIVKIVFSGPFLGLLIFIPPTFKYNVGIKSKFVVFNPPTHWGWGVVVYAPLWILTLLKKIFRRLIPETGKIFFDLFIFLTFINTI